jgi:hypothetical protein
VPGTREATDAHGAERVLERLRVRSQIDHGLLVVQLYVDEARSVVVEVDRETRSRDPERLEQGVSIRL